MLQERLGEYRWKNATFPGSLSACLGLCIHIQRNVIHTYRDLFYVSRQILEVFEGKQVMFLGLFSPI